MTDKRKNQIAGLSGGLINGLFGGGGGMVLLPLLTRWRRVAGGVPVAGAAWAGHGPALSGRGRGGGPDRRRGL